MTTGVGLTRKQLREEVGRFFGLFEGQVASGSTVALVCNEITRFADDYWNGANLLISDTTDDLAPLAESDSFITDFDRATGTLTFLPALSATVGQYDVFQLYQNVTVANIHAALNQACQGASIVTQLTPADDTLDYNLTGAPFLYRPQQLTGVWRRPLNDDQTLPYQIMGYQVEDAEGCLTLRLPYVLDLDDGFWVTYEAGEYSLEDDDAAIWNLPMAVIKARAIVWLLERHVYNMDSTGRERQGVMLRYWQEQLLRAERAYQRPSGKVNKHVWSRDVAAAIDGDARAVTY